MRIFLMRVLNLGLYLSLCALAGTGLLLSFRLPPGSRGGRGLQVLGMNRHDWGDIHFWIGMAFLTLILIHLAQNWKWLRMVAARQKVWPLALGLGVGLTIIAGFLLLPVTGR